MKAYYLIFISLILSCYQAFSLDTEFVSLYSDHKARRIGDIVTIIVSESSKASKSDTTQTSKKSGANGSLSELFGLGNLPLKANVEGGSAYSDSGLTTRSGTMDAKISVSVKEVLPNGNLKLEGTRNISVNNDVQTITISGIVRPEDIRPDNTVLSIYLADAQILYKGQGNTSQRPGIVTGAAKILMAPFHFVSNIFRKIL